jgi:hypothetical protein
MRRIFLIPALILTFALPMQTTVYAEARCDPDGSAMMEIVVMRGMIRGLQDAGVSEDALIDRFNSNLRRKNENEANVAIKVAHHVFSKKWPMDDADNSEYRDLLKLCAEEPPPMKPNPKAGGQHDSGGNPASNDTDALSAAQRGEIGAHVRECWTKDSGAQGLDKLSVVLNIVTDASSRTREVTVADEDRDKLSDPVFQAFAKRAIRAAMDIHCATLPLPHQMLGRINNVTFRFRP